jgi:hypothetical protein
MTTPPAPHPTESLSLQELLADLDQLYRTRIDTLRHGAREAVASSAERIAELEAEYLRRLPEREVDPHRLRPDGPQERAG